MNPVIDRKGSYFALHKKNSKKNKDSKKKIQKDVKKIEKIDTTKINGIFRQFETVRLERQKLEHNKKIWINEFVKKEAAFLINLSKNNDSSHQQALLLALSSKSLNDFVHSTIVLNYLQQYFAYNNQVFLNFIKNIRETNNKIQYCTHLESKLIEDWNKEKFKIDALQSK
ncbi:MAG: hypothetical protein LBS83_02775 [Holosporales bacterium]|jgi:hypothetical protein|nr:hypothetical protein [Holosporales bacterium]